MGSTAPGPQGTKAGRPAVPAWVMWVGFALIPAIGLVDWATGYELDLGVLYLAPVGLLAWERGLWAGLAGSFLGGIASALAEILGERLFTAFWIPLANGLTGAISLAVLAWVLVRLRAALDRERIHARQDRLTGLLNRAGFLEVVEAEVERARRYGHPLALAYLDLDDFKAVNDREGHQAGDRLLAMVAGILRGELRDTDRPARLGGDEFAVLLPEIESELAVALAQRLGTRIEEAMTREGWGVTASIGLAAFRRPPQSVDELVSRADGLMYRAKADGKRSLKHWTW